MSADVPDGGQAVRAGSPDAARGRRVLLAALLAMLFAGVLHGPRIGAPLETSLASESTTYMVLFFRNWDHLGWWTLRGVPTVGLAGANLQTREPYVHHPPAGYWLIYLSRSLGGWNEAAFRLVPFLATVLAAGLVTLLAGRFVPAPSALLAGLFYPVLGIVFAFGLMTNTDPLSVALILAGLLAWLRFRERPGRARWWAVALLAFGAAWIEWQATFFVPAILLAEWLTPAASRRLRPALALLLPLLVGALVLGAWYAAAWGSLPGFATEIAAVARGAMKGRPDATWPTFFANQVEAWRQYLGWPALAFTAALLLLAALRPRILRTPQGRCLAALLLPALLAVALFRSASFDHGFFWLPIAAFLPVALAVAHAALARRHPTVAILLVLTLFASSAWLDLRHDHRTRKATYRDLGTLVNRVAPADALVLTAEPFGPAAFYTRAHLRSGITRPALIETALALRARPDADFSRILVLMLPSSVAQHPDLVAWLAAHAQELPLSGARGWVVP